MIPESYVPDLQLRLALYRRLAELENTQEIDAFGAELIDRFGSLPEEVEHLLKIVFIKALCRQANVEKLDAGPKGVVIQFRKREFADPVGAGPLHRRAGLAGQDQAGPERRVHPRLADRREAPRRRGRGDDATGAAGDEGGGLVLPCRSGQFVFSSSPRALAAATWRMASAMTLLSCAPITAYLPSIRKQGTPVTPMRCAVSISPRTASASASVASKRLDDRRIHAAFARRRDQHGMIADIGAFLEIELEQAPRQPVLHRLAGGPRPADDAMSVERVGRDLDRVEGEVDADRFAERLEALHGSGRMRSSLPNLSSM